MLESEHRTFNIEHPTSNEGKKSRRISREAAMGLMAEYDLLLQEVETLLTEQLIGVSLLRQRGGPYDPAEILEIPIRLLRLKKNRSIREEAILAYAAKKLEELRASPEKGEQVSRRAGEQGREKADG